MLLLLLQSDAPAREVLHFHYKKWPDFQLPDTAEDFLDFLWAIRESGVMSNDVGGLVVHCRLVLSLLTLNAIDFFRVCTCMVCLRL